MDSVTFRVDGLSDMINALGKFSTKIEKEISLEVAASALKIQTEAKKNAPVNLGTLRNSIHLTSTLSEKKTIYRVSTPLKYAPYIEFGTGGKVKVDGYESFASQFKGSKSGTFKEMLAALAEWVAKKGLAGTYSVKTRRRTGTKSKRASQDMKVAYAIAISILRKGLRPQPFLLPAFETEKAFLKSKIKDIIRNAKS
ncbi:phge_HK97_gp10, phage protein, HK97 gp10 family [uncultured Caudovirales phage]|uniref:Phge_HK97_gp10, phage protein, HK97 gp10 family n=1 Tax=uncultured Caudovirales phage TaxID=2100421 RepID=A0A6J7WNH3_9CAUD|nr:phge_HK97_gp10, phage protein, HK97 gp10 family [uncultured Caudovirales phage]